MSEAVCSNCNERKPSHESGNNVDGVTRLCCICYVVAGNPPADWHTYCMKTKQWLDALKAAEVVA